MQAIGSQKRRKRDLNSTGQYGFRQRLSLTLNNVELLQRRRSQSRGANQSFECITPQALQNFQTDEVKRLEENLTRKELEIFKDQELGFKDTISVYTEFLENLSLLVKYKSNVYGNLLIRGLLGIKKALNKTLQKSRLKQQLEDLPKMCYAWTQTPTLQELDLQAYDELQLLYKTDEFEFIKSLLTKVEGLDASRVHYRLLAIYRRLCKVKGFIEPEVGNIEALDDLLPQRMYQDIQDNLQSVHKDLTQYVLAKSLKSDGMEMGIQTEFNVVNESEYLILKQMLDDRELQNFKLRNQLSKSEKQYSKISRVCEEYKQKSQLLDEKTYILQQAQESIKRLQSNQSKIQSKWKRVMYKKQQLKRKYNEILKKLKASQQELVQMDDLLVQFKTKYAITNENLKEIQAAWFREFNDDFVFREIDEEALKQKYGIVAKQREQIQEDLLKSGNSDSEIEVMDEIPAYFYQDNSPVTKLQKQAPAQNQVIQKRHVKQVSKPQTQQQEVKQRTYSYEKSTAEEVIQQQTDQTEIQQNQQKPRLQQGRRHTTRKGQPRNVQISYEEPSTQKNIQTETITILQPDYYYKQLLDLQNISSDQIQELETFLQIKDDEFSHNLTNSQLTLYTFIKQAMDRLKQLKQQLLLQDNSKQTQTDFRITNINSPDITKMRANSTIGRIHKEQSPQISIQARSAREEEMIARLSSPSARKKRPQTQDSFNQDGIPRQLAILIQRVMIGHDDRCGAECKHLKKAMALKKKFFGTLYPVKKHNVQYVDFDLF